MAWADGQCVQRPGSILDVPRLFDQRVDPIPAVGEQQTQQMHAITQPGKSIPLRKRFDEANRRE